MTAERHLAALREMREIIEEESREKALRKIAHILRRRFRHYTWVGFYWLQGDELVLRAYSGDAETTHKTIPLGKGICGAAAKGGETIVVPDVSKDSRYLMCFMDTKSEIVVPIKYAAKVLGEIDIDSNHLEAFTQEDKLLLESLAAVLAEEQSKT